MGRHRFSRQRRVHIGSDVMIGAGSVVLQDIPDGVLAYGVPAAVIRKQVPPDKREVGFGYRLIAGCEARCVTGLKIS